MRPHAPSRYVRTVSPAALPVDIAAIKARLSIEAADTTDDALLTDLLTSVVSRLDGWAGFLGRAIVTQTWRMEVRGPAENIVRIGLGPVQSVSSVTSKIDGTDTVWADYRLQYDARGAFIEPADNKSWPAYDDCQDAFKITHVSGYGVAADVPEGLKDIIVTICAHRYLNRETETIPPHLKRDLIDYCGTYV